jgi:hypothetical protein
LRGLVELVEVLGDVSFQPQEWDEHPQLTSILADHSNQAQFEKQCSWILPFLTFCVRIPAFTKLRSDLLCTDYDGLYG